MCVFFLVADFIFIFLQQFRNLGILLPRLLRRRRSWREDCKTSAGNWEGRRSKRRVCSLSPRASLSLEKCFISSLPPSLPPGGGANGASMPTPGSGSNLAANLELKSSTLSASSSSSSEDSDDDDDDDDSSSSGSGSSTSSSSDSEQGR